MKRNGQEPGSDAKPGRSVDIPLPENQDERPGQKITEGRICGYENSAGSDAAYGSEEPAGPDAAYDSADLSWSDTVCGSEEPAGSVAAYDSDDLPEPDDAEQVCREWIVPAEYAGQRLDLFLTDHCGSCTRSYLQKLIKSGSVTADGKPAKPGLKVEAGVCVRAVFPPVRELTAEPENIPLDILYEDDDLLVVNKPKGMVVHPAAGHPDGTLVNALLYHCRGSLSGINGVLRPGIVHRIDRDTTGSLIVCKNDRAHQAIAAQLKVHSITRKYRAIVHGRLNGDGTVNAPVGRHPQRRMEMAVNVPGGKPAVTHYHVLETFDRFTSIECRLETGRTHQIRVHMKSIGHPILGDVVYGPARCPFPGLQGQTLHAMTIGFVHPSTGTYMEFEAPLPEYFRELLQKLRGKEQADS